ERTDAPQEAGASWTAIYRGSGSGSPDVSSRTRRWTGSRAGREAVALSLAPQGGGIDPEACSRLLQRLGILQHPLDVLPLELLEGERARPRTGGWARRASEQPIRKIVGRDRVAGRQDHGALQDVHQLAVVAGPVVAGEQQAGVARDSDGPATMASS